MSILSPRFVLLGPCFVLLRSCSVYLAMEPVVLMKEDIFLIVLVLDESKCDVTIVPELVKEQLVVLLDSKCFILLDNDATKGSK